MSTVQAASSVVFVTAPKLSEAGSEEPGHLGHARLWGTRDRHPGTFILLPTAEEEPGRALGKDISLCKGDRRAEHTLHPAGLAREEQTAHASLLSTLRPQHRADPSQATASPPRLLVPRGFLGEPDQSPSSG